MRIRFEQVDVFTERPFAGNPLCVVPDGTGLSTEQMQAIAREMNLSETTFVLPPTDPQACYWMRIFTPAKEIPFAGHPSVGTAYVMACAGRFPLQEPVTRIFQQVGIGILPLDIEVSGGKPGRVVMTQGKPTFGAVLRDLTPLGETLGVDAGTLAKSSLPAQVVSTGLGHLMVPLPDLVTVGRLQPNLALLDTLLRDCEALGCFVFCLQTTAPDVFAHAGCSRRGRVCPRTPRPARPSARWERTWPSTTCCPKTGHPSWSSRVSRWAGPVVSGSRSSATPRDCPRRSGSAERPSL
jgi:trans-2,3-dihydro-3-hydroxyanthranilate isomerase